MSDRYQWQVDLRTPYTELEHYQQDRLMRTVIRAILVMTLLVMIPYGYAALRSSLWQGIVVNGLQALLLLDLYLSHRELTKGFVQRAAYMLIPFLMLVVTVNGLMIDSVNTLAPVLLSLIVVAGIVLGSQGNLLTAILALILWLAALVVDRMGMMPPSPLPEFVSSAVFLILTAVSFFFIAVVGYSASRRLQQALSDANYQLVESNVKLEEANRLKTQFTARTSHELRTPLNAIVVSADLMNRKLYGDLTEDQVDALDRILRNTRRLQRLIDDILDLAKIEAGRLELVERPFQINTLIDTLRTSLEPKARARGLEFYVTVSPDMPRTIVADEHRITQILTNLIDNAIKFTDQGDISVMMELSTGSRWKLQVQDTGRGIHEKEFERIFEEFRRSETAGAVAGTGLGLPITKQLIDLMNGTIRLRSQLGKGSTFEVVLPLKVAPEQPAPAAGVKQPDLNTVKSPG
jgi:signal transduction histidine kinase